MSDYRTLRLMIRKMILESVDEDGEAYEDTYIDTDEPAPAGSLLAEPHHGHEERRISYIKSKEERKKDSENSSQEDKDSDETHCNDEHAIVGAIGPMGAGNGPGRKPYQKQRKLKPKNAMSISKALDEYDE